MKNLPIELQENISKLAKSMNVSEEDVLCLAKGVINSFDKDGVTDKFMEATEDIQGNLVTAYSKEEVKKVESLHTELITNPEAKDKFCKYVYNIL